MAFNEELASRIRLAVAGQKTIVEKQLFGGLAFLRNGHVLVGAWNDSLLVRVGPVAYSTAIREPHVKDFDITGKPLKGWVLVKPAGLEDDDQLVDWIKRATKFVKTLPSK